MPAPRRHSNESQKRGTATEHAKQSQKRGTATEHAKQPVVLKRNPETQQKVQFMEEARADRADDSLEQLAFKLADFLTHVMRQLYPFLLKNRYRTSSRGLPPPDPRGGLSPVRYC